MRSEEYNEVVIAQGERDNALLELQKAEVRISELEDEVEHWRLEAELPVRIANSDSAVMQLAELRKEYYEMRDAIRTGRWADALDIATRHTVIA